MNYRRRAVLRFGTLESRIAPALFRVLSTADSGSNTLRQALLDANSTGGADTIAFQLPGFGVRTIAPATPLPAVTGPTTIDGWSQPDALPTSDSASFDGLVRVQLSGQNAGVGAVGLDFAAGSGGSLVRGLAINRFNGAGVRVAAGASNFTIEGCLIGTTADGQGVAGNGIGIDLAAGISNALIGGTTAQSRNVIASNVGAGISIGTGSSGVLVRGNHLGVLANELIAANGGPAVLGPAELLDNVYAGVLNPGGSPTPAVVASVASASGLTVTMEFTAAGDRDYRLELFAGGHPQGTVNVVMPAAGTAKGDVLVSAFTVSSGVLTATLTDLKAALTSPASIAVEVPVGKADVFHVLQDGGISKNVLDNDIGPGEVLAKLITPPTDARFQLREDGSFGFSPTTGINGADSFMYAPSTNGFDGLPVLAEVYVHPWKTKAALATVDYDYVNHKSINSGGTGEFVGSPETGPYELILEGKGVTVAVTDFNWEVDNFGGTPFAYPLHLEFAGGPTTSRLFGHTVSGFVHSSVELALYNPQHVEYGRLSLFNAKFQSFATGAGSIITDAIDAVAEKYELRSRTVDAMGNVGNWLISTWDTIKGAVSDLPVPPLTETGGTTLAFLGTSTATTNLKNYQWEMYSTPGSKAINGEFLAEDTFNTVAPTLMSLTLNNKTLTKVTANTDTPVDPWTTTWTMGSVSVSRLALTGDDGKLPLLSYTLNATDVDAITTGGADSHASNYDFSTGKGFDGGTGQLFGGANPAPHVLTFNGGGGEVEVKAFRWQITPGATTPDTFNFDLAQGPNSPRFFGNTALGYVNSSAALSLRTPAGLEYGRFTFTSPFITRFATGDLFGVADYLDLSFTKLEIRSWGLDGFGVPGSTPSISTWDVTKGTFTGTTLPTLAETGATTLTIGAMKTDLQNFEWSIERGVGGSAPSHNAFKTVDTFNFATPAMIAITGANKSSTSATLATTASADPWDNAWSLSTVTFNRVEVFGELGNVPQVEWLVNGAKVTATSTDGVGTQTANWDYSKSTGTAGSTGGLIGTNGLTAPYALSFGGTLLEIEALEFDWQTLAAGTAKAVPYAFTVKVQSGPNTPRFFANTASGTRSTEAELSVRDRYGYEYGLMTLTNVAITALKTDGTGHDTLSLFFDKIQLLSRVPGSTVTSTWDISKNTITTGNLPSLAEGGAITVKLENAPTTDVESFSWSTTNYFGNVDQSTFAVEDQFNLAAPGLLANVANRKAFTSVTLQSSLTGPPGRHTWTADDARLNRFHIAGASGKRINVDFSYLAAKVSAAAAERTPAPIGTEDFYSVPAGTALHVDAAGVLANDIAWPGLPMYAEIVAPPSQGSLSLGKDGTIDYAPPLGFSGIVTFTYAPYVGDPATFVSYGVPTKVTIEVVDPNNVPTAKLNASQFISAGLLIITYADDTGIEFATIDDADLLVTGPHGYSRAPRLVSVTPSGNGTPRTATYAADIPGGNWEAGDSGLYTVFMNDQQVFDTNLPRHPVPASKLGGVQFGPSPPPTVDLVMINDGSAQRSRVTTILVNFDQAVTLPANPASAFQLKRQSDNAVVALSAMQVGNLVTLTFTGGAVDANSLADGRYTLTVLASQVSSGNFDGNGDGTTGDNFVLVGDPGAEPKLFRLFGDVDGDGDCDTSDFAVFRASYGGVNDTFDFDNDGDVDTTDFGAFRGRYGSMV